MQKLEKLSVAPPALLKFIRTMHVRTRFFDDAITCNLAASVSPPQQVVALGAGLDTRAYRVEELTQAVTYYEVDRAEMNAYKNDILKDKHAKCMLNACEYLSTRIYQMSIGYRINLRGIQ